MTIDPQGKIKNLTYTFEVAAVDLPVPERLLDRQDQQEWASYIECLTPAGQLRKFAQAVDQFHALLYSTDPSSLPEDTQKELFSKWQAASIIHASIAKRLQFGIDETAENGARPFTSDLERGMHYVIDFLKGVNSPDVPAWEDRHARQRAITRPPFRDFLSKVWGEKGDFKPRAPKAAPPAP
jgi:hypothetical protein